MPPADMTAKCDTTEIPVNTVGDSVDELTSTRQQRDTCAAKVDALRDWSNRAN